MNLRLSKEFFFKLQMLTLVLSSTLGTFLVKLLPSGALQMIFFIVPGVMTLLMVSKNVLRINWQDVLLICIFLMMCLKGDILAHHVNYFIFIGIVFFFIVSKYFIGWIDKILSMYIVPYIVYMFCTIWFFFDSRTYLGYVVNLFPNTREKLISWYAQGCMAGLTNHYSTNGMFLAAGLIIATYRLVSEEKHKKLNIILWCLMVVALLLTGKRAHILFSFISLFIVYYFYNIDKKNRFIKIIGILIAVVIVALILFMCFPQLATFLERFEETAAEGDITLGRTLFWAIAIELFFKNPILGVGWMNYPVYTQQQINYGTHAHNVYLQILCETGVVGSALFFLWFGYMLISAIKLLKKIKFIGYGRWKKQQGHMVFSLSMQIFFLLYCFTGNPIYDKEMYVPYFIACAITVYYKNNIQRDEEKGCIG